MTNQNNAAQAAEQAIKAAIRKAYDDGYNDAKMAPDNCSTYCVERAVRLDSAALLSKLRAPVADDTERGLTSKQVWWAGYRAGKGVPPDTPRQDAVNAALRCRKCGEQANVRISSAHLVTHRPDGTPRDERDIASDPEGKLIHDPAEPLLAASAPVADERAAFEAIVKRLGGDCTWRPGYGYVSSMTRLYQNFWRQIHAEQGNRNDE